jgi:C-1 hydroxylase
MASKNVESVRAAHESWNRRDFDGIVRNMADNLVYADRPRNLTIKGKQKFKEWTQAWAKAFSDGRITKAEYIDAGDTVVAQFTVEGTNDGPFAGLPATGRRMICAYCEISRFDKSGRVISGDGYYDQYTMLVQLGHVQPLATAA